MEINGAKLQVNAYVFSTDTVNSSTLTAAYSGTTHYKTKVSWTYDVVVQPNCALGFIHPTELASDTNAQLSSTKSVSSIVQSAATN